MSLLTGAGLITACVSNGSGARVAATEPPGLAAALRSDVQVLAGEIGIRAALHDDSLARAERWLITRLTAQGWTVERQAYAVAGVECANLIVERRGLSKTDEIVIVGAHYDTVTYTPGADDNASGVAALLALASAYAPAGFREGGDATRSLPPARAPECTIRFVAFTNEEPAYFQTELMGSRVYAKACKARGDKIVAMLSLETMGYYRDEKGSQKYPFPLSLFYPSRGDFLAVVGNRDSQPLVKRVAKLLRQTRTIPVEAASLPAGLPGVGWSDHWSFWHEGYQAVMLTDTAPFRNPNYHEPSDKPDTLDYPRLAAAVHGLAAVVDELVRGEPAR